MNTSKIVSLPEWMRASVLDRHTFLISGYNLDPLGSQVLHFAQALRDAGGIIDDHVILSVYNNIKANGARG